MSPIGWMAIGAAGLSFLGVLVMAAIEREFRQALGQVAAAFVVGPALLIAWAVRGGIPRAMRLSPRALELFARQQSGGGKSAWLLGYRSRGVIVVRRRHGQGWLNDVPNRASRARRDK